MREPELVASNPAAAQAAIEGVLVPADEAGRDLGLEAALDEHVREQGSTRIVAFGSELSGLYWLDSVIVALSLGHMGILMHSAALTAACVTTAFLLAPRRVDDGLERASRGTGADGGERSMDILGVPEGPLGDTGCESGAAALERQADVHGAAGGVSVGHKAVLPALQAHWAALGQDGLLADDAVDLILGLVAWSAERRRAVERVLYAYGVPYEARDGSNLVCGLLGVHPEALPKGQLSVARREAAPSSWTISGLAEAVRTALPGINAKAFAADVVAGTEHVVGVGVGGGGKGGVAMARRGCVCGGCGAKRVGAFCSVRRPNVASALALDSALGRQLPA